MSILTTSPLKSAPSAATGVAITAAMKPAWGAWVQVIAATAAPIAIAGVQFTGGTFVNQDYDLDIGTGAAGAEVSVGTLRLLIEVAPPSVSSPYGVLLPVPLGGIGAGVRVAVRARITSGVAGPATVAVLYYETFSSDHVTTSSHVLSAAPPATLSATITPNATAWANSAWVELIASTATDLGLLGLAHSTIQSTGVDGYEFDLGIGAAGAETVITTLRDASYGPTIHHTPHTWLPGIYPVPAGTRVAIRLRKAGTTTASYFVSLLYYTGVSAITTTNHGFRGDVSPGAPLEVSYLSTAAPLYVFVTWYVLGGGFDHSDAVSGITFNGVALERGGHQAVMGNTMEWWRLTTPTAGVGTVSLATVTEKRVSMGIMNLTGWPATIAEHTFAADGDAGYLRDPSVRIPTGAGAPIVSWLGFNGTDQDVTMGPGQTAVWNEEGLNITPPPDNDQLSAGSTAVGVAPSTLITWTLSEPQDAWGLAALSSSLDPLQKVTQQVLLVGVDEDDQTSPPITPTPCVGGGDVADGVNPAPAASLATATVPIAWVELELVGGTRYRYAKAAIPHGTPKDGRVLTFGRVSRSLTDGDGGPQAAVVTTVLGDTDRVLRAAAWAGTLHFALVEYFVSDLETIRAGGTPHRVFRGRVQDWTADQNLTLTLTVQDELSARLTSSHATDVQSPIRTIDRTMHDFQPLASLFGQAAPEIYGSLSDAHEDPPIGESGTWELRHIADQTIDPGPYAALGQLAVFLVCSGAVGQIQQVYAGDPSEDPPTTRRPVPASAFGNWLFAPGIAWIDATRYWLDTAGRRWTVVLGLASHPVIKLAVEGRIPLVVNLCGYEDFGEGTGETLERPARAFLHWLNNRVVQDTPEDWAPIFSLGEYSLFDTTTFDAVDALCEARGYRVAGVIGHDYAFVSWRDRVAEWCRNFGFELGTNKHGQVICVLLDPVAPSVATLTPATILEGGCAVTMRADAVETIVPYVYARNYVTSIQRLNPLPGERGLRDPFDGEWQSDRLEVVNEASITALGGRPRGERRARLQEYSLVRDETTAETVAGERLALRSRPNGRAEVTFDLFLRDGAALELGDVVAVEHWDLPWTGPRRCHVRAVELDLDDLTLTLTVRDVEDLLET